MLQPHPGCSAAWQRASFGTKRPWVQIPPPRPRSEPRSGTSDWALFIASTAGWYSNSGTAELGAKPLERIAGHRWRDIGVDVHGDRDVAVPQYRHRHPGVDVERSQQTCAGVPGVMYPDPANAGTITHGIKAAVEMARIDGAAVPAGEHKPGFVPFLSRGGGPTVDFLSLAPVSEHADAEVWQRKRCLRRVGLGLSVEQLAAHSLQLPADVDLGRVQVHVVPREPEHFSLAQA